jgi:chloramphenicol-sensitive protein RarD
MQEDRKGLAIGISAFLLWGLYPAYFRALAHVGPWEIVAHRIVWSTVLLAILLACTTGFSEARAALGARGSLLTLLATTLLILINWLVYVIAVLNGQVLDASLGYFLCPLVVVALGITVLRERLSAPQLAAVLLAAAAVANLVWQQGVVPRVALILAVSFAIYGLLRKRLHVSPATGLFLECLLSLPIAVGLFVWLGWRGEQHFLTESATTDLLLLAAGFVTVGPLLLFNQGAKRLRYTTLGVLQYIAPSMLFLQGWLLFGEPLSFWRLVTFLAIWAALALYSLGSLRGWRTA